MRALQYFFGEAVESLWRTRKAALLSILTIGAGLFVLGFLLMVNANVDRIDAVLLTLRQLYQRTRER